MALKQVMPPLYILPAPRQYQTQLQGQKLTNFLYQLSTLENLNIVWMILVLSNFIELLNDLMSTPRVHESFNFLKEILLWGFHTGILWSRF